MCATRSARERRFLSGLVVAVPLSLSLLAACSGTTENPSSGTEGSGGGATSASSASSGQGGQASSGTNNVLLVIADDLGVDSSVCYTVGKNLGKAPNIEALCSRGVVFDNAWAMPTCSPSRATLLTGRYGFRTGVGAQITGPMSAALNLTEQTLPRALEMGAPGARASAAVGKWHLSTGANGGDKHPNLAGFSRYIGYLGGTLPDYFSWPRTVDGVTATSTEYATTVAVNDARDWLSAQTSPWFLWLAFNAPHSPYHLPPVDLHSYDTLPSSPIPAKPTEYYKASIEAMDTELGRLFGGLGKDALDHTWIIYVGDNGTAGQVVEAPSTSDHAKDTLYEGGVHVPLIIAGPGVVQGGRRVSALVNTVDVFSTILELSGVETAKAVPAGVTIDSVSLTPYLTDPAQASLRKWAFSEKFGGTTMTDSNGKTIRDEAFKLLRLDSGKTEVYDLRVDPLETKDLVAAGPLTAEAQQHMQDLEGYLDKLLASP